MEAAAGAAAAVTAGAAAVTAGVAAVTLSNGVAMPLLGLGTFQVRDTLCVDAVKAAIAAGYRHIDTAAIYRNEEAVAKGIAESGVPREQLFITSKLKPHDHGEGAYAAAVASLERLSTPYFDLYLIHWPGVAGKKLDDPAQKDIRKASWLALQRLYDEGKARAIGVSNYMPGHLEELCTAPWCTVKPHVNQFELHPLLQQADVVAACRAHGIAVEAYTSLAQGDAKLLAAPAVTAAAAAHGVTPAQVCLRWAVQKGYVVLPRSTKSERIVSNGAIFGWELTGDEMAALDALECGHRFCWDPTAVKA